MKKDYLNKEMKAQEIKRIQKVPKYTGQVELYFPEYKKVVNNGDFLEELPIEEARKRDDFIIIERRR